MNQRATRIKSVHHAEFHWRNNRGQTFKKKPRVPTVWGRPVSDMRPECRERALREQDVWKPVVELFLSMARTIEYQGDRAKNIWRDYCAGVFGKKKGKTV